MIGNIAVVFSSEAGASDNRYENKKHITTEISTTPYDRVGLENLHLRQMILPGRTKLPVSPIQMKNQAKGSPQNPFQAKDPIGKENNCLVLSRENATEFHQLTFKLPQSPPR